MAVLSVTELARVREACAVKMAPVAYTKPNINAALQAIEDTMTTTPIAGGQVGQTIQQIISAAIDAAQPFNFTNAQKKILFALWAELKFRKDIT